MLNEGSAHLCSVRETGDAAGEGQDALLGSRIPAPMRDSQKNGTHDAACVVRTTPVNRNSNPRAQEAHSHEPPAAPAGRRSWSPQYGQ